MKTIPIPSSISLLLLSKQIRLSYEDGQVFDLSFEYLRVFSPSAEVKGHGGGVGGQLPLNKQEVLIEKIDPIGNYAVKFYFSDKHDTGIYSWDVLWDLATNQAKLWAEYLAKVDQLAK